MNRVFIGVLLMLGMLSVASSDDSGVLSIVGKENGADAGSPTFGIALDRNNKSWREFEPGGKSEFFKTKSGKYAAPPGLKTVYLCKTDNLADCIKQVNSQAGQLLPLIPDTATKGDVGRGHAEETGKELDWHVE